jgi:hypothetical protein
MDDSMMLTVAILVFIMMVIGLGLTILEFRYGQPRRESNEVQPTSGIPGQSKQAKTA